MRFVRLVHRHMVKMVQRVVELIGGGSVYNMQPETGSTSLVIEHRTLLLPVNDLLLQKELPTQIGHQRKAKESAVSDEEDLTYSGGCDEGEMPRYRFRGGQTHSENRLSQTPDARHALRLQPVSFLLLKILNANDRKVKVCDVSDLET